MHVLLPCVLDLIWLPCCGELCRVSHPPDVGTTCCIPCAASTVYHILPDSHCLLSWFILYIQYVGIAVTFVK